LAPTPTLILTLALGAGGCLVSFDDPPGGFPDAGDGGDGGGSAECGNGVREAGESCDGSDLGAMTCVDLDQPPGALGCLPDCRFDVARCGDCGNGDLDPGEACDDGNAVAGDGCDDACQVEPGWSCETEGDQSVCRCIVYVDVAASGAEPDGESWATAFQDLPAAVEAAVARGDCEVWVAAGTYRVWAPGRTDGLRLPARAPLYGGFAGGETAREARDPLQNLTIIDGRKEGSPTEAVEHVVRATAVSAGVLDGFTVTGGFSYTVGGGLLADSSVLRVSRCRFETNFALDGGGGVALLNSEATFEQAYFWNNSTNAGSGESGGALRASNSAVGLNRCWLEGNEADLGGAVSASGGSLRVLSSVLLRNKAGQRGGAIGVGDGGSLELVNSTFTLNEAGESLAGGALDCRDSTCEVANCVLWGDLPRELPQLTPSPFTLRYSLVEGGAVGEGVIDADPLFVDVSLGQLGLQAGSPAVDAADGALAPTFDYHGKPRHDAASVDDTGTGTPSYADMGAMEWHPEGP
jgi:cysteine-rich repeat protein